MYKKNRTAIKAMRFPKDKLLMNCNLRNIRNSHRRDLAAYANPLKFIRNIEPVKSLAFRFVHQKLAHRFSIVSMTTTQSSRTVRMTDFKRFSGIATHPPV